MTQNLPQTANSTARQSKLGLISLISSIVSLILVIGVFPLMSVLEATEYEVPEPWQSIGMAYLPLAALLAMTAVITGVIGLFPKNRRKGFAIAGLIVGGCSILLWIGIVIVVLVLLPGTSAS